MSKFKLRNGKGNAVPFKALADMGFTSEPDGGPGGKKPPTGEVNPDLVDKYGSLDSNLGIEGDFGKVNYESSKEKKGKGSLDNIRMAIMQSNFVRKHSKLNNALSNAFSGSKYEYDTPWKRYRAAVKDFKQKEIKEKTDPFSKERRLAKQDLRGKFDSTGKRLSAKNIYQQKYLVNRRRGKDGNTARGFHNPHIPEIKTRVSFAEWRQNKRNQKEIATGGVKIGGCKPSGGKFSGGYEGKSTDTFGHGSQCGPRGI